MNNKISWNCTICTTHNSLIAAKYCIVFRRKWSYFFKAFSLPTKVAYWDMRLPSRPPSPTVSKPKLWQRLVEEVVEVSCLKCAKWIKLLFFLVKMSIHRGSHLYISLNKKMRLFRYLPRYLSSIILFQCQHRLDEGQWLNVFLCRIKNLIFLCGFPYPTVYKSCIIYIVLLKMFLLYASAPLM